MKQKNLILVAVAVGCGLVAAVLTSQMSAGTAPVVETVEVPVAAKELAQGTWLKKADVKTYVTYKKFPKENLPAAFSSSTDELEDKRLARMVRAGEPFNPADLTTNVSLQPPAGMNMVTLPIAATEAAAGFCVPGSRVDVLASVQMNSLGGRAIVFPMLVDMLVLAVDTQTSGPQQGGAVGNLGSVSFAVTNAQAQIVHAAKTRGAQLRLVLRNPEKPSSWPYIPSDKEVWGILADDPKRAFSQDGREITEEAKDTKLKLPVPKEDLPAGTRLTDEVLKDKFTTIEFTPPAPANILADAADLKDQYLLNGLAANQFVPKTYVGAKPNQKAAPADDDAPRSKEEPLQTAQGPKAAPKAVAKDAPVYHDVTIQTTSGTTTVRYQKLTDGGFKYVGVVPTGGGKSDDKKDEAGADEDDAPVKKPAPKKPAATDADDAPEKKPAGR